MPRTGQWIGQPGQPLTLDAQALPQRRRAPPHHELAPEAERPSGRPSPTCCGAQLQAALQSIWLLVTRANQYVDQTAPFKLAKDTAQAARLAEVLYNLAKRAVFSRCCFWPFVPATGKKCTRKLGLSEAPGQAERSRLGRVDCRKRICLA